jgi:hypothetical protein
MTLPLAPASLFKKLANNSLFLYIGIRALNLYALLFFLLQAF